jgi:hypothetical protein
VTAFRVVVDVSEARAGVREAIIVDVVPDRMNPGDVVRLAGDLRTAAALVNKLAPPAALGRGLVGARVRLGQAMRRAEAFESEGYAAHTDDDGRRGD